MNGVLIYLIRAGETNKYKIGYSTPWTLDKRVKDLQVGCPDKLEVIDWVLSRSTEDEKTLHRIYGQYRIHGEWFVINNVPWFQILRAIDPVR